jgi:hypothetical protein
MALQRILNYLLGDNKLKLSNSLSDIFQYLENIKISFNFNGGGLTMKDLGNFSRASIAHTIPDGRLIRIYPSSLQDQRVLNWTGALDDDLNVNKLPNVDFTISNLYYTLSDNYKVLGKSVPYFSTLDYYTLFIDQLLDGDTSVNHFFSILFIDREDIITVQNRIRDINENKTKGSDVIFAILKGIKLRVSLKFT